MALPGPDVPIIGQPRRLVIQDFQVVAPNQIDVSPNGLDMGDCVAHQRITNPIKASQVWVPMTMQQVDELLGDLHRLRQVLLTVNTQEDNHHGVN